MKKPSPQPIERSRSAEVALPGRPATDGAGVRLLRSLGPELHQRLDPFLLLDEFSSDDPNAYVAGFPDHPHRGFETVTYMLAGSMQHRDSVGNTGNLRAGSVQWMTAASGVIHSEMPQQEEGLLRGFQLWVNLPGAHKMDPPAYQEFDPESVPRYRTESGVEATVVAGRSLGVEGAAQQPLTDPLYVDLRIGAEQSFDHPLTPGHNALLYVYEGEVRVGGGDPIGPNHLVVLGNEEGADGVSLRTEGAPARLLLLAGRPLREPVFAAGPFVMNTRREIEQAFDDYRSGRFASID